jgi:hypothetical protein
VICWFHLSVTRLSLPSVTAGAIKTRYVKLWSNFDSPEFQISQLVVNDHNGINVAVGKTCTASSSYDSSSTCEKAIDGNLANRDYPNIYLSAINAGPSWFLLDLGSVHAVTSVIYYNRNVNQFRSNGIQLQLLDKYLNVTAQRTLDTSAVQNLTFSTATLSLFPIKYNCENTLEGGGWVLVRRVKAGARWHPATDDLGGFDVYGTYGTALSSATFSIAYSTWLKQTTQLLFMTGTRARTCAFNSRKRSDLLISHR